MYLNKIRASFISEELFLSGGSILSWSRFFFGLSVDFFPSGQLAGVSSLLVFVAEGREYSGHDTSDKDDRDPVLLLVALAILVSWIKLIGGNISGVEEPLTFVSGNLSWTDILTIRDGLLEPVGSANVGNVNIDSEGNLGKEGEPGKTTERLRDIVKTTTFIVKTEVEAPS